MKCEGILAISNEEIKPPQEPYLRPLETINGIKFTHREIDIIAFIVSGRSSKKIAHSLSISSRTVDNHTRNIMIKLACNSREAIIDFVEQSGKIQEIKRHYAALLAQVSFKKCLQHIRAVTIKKASHCLIVYWNDSEDKDPLVYQLAEYLKAAGVKIILAAQKNCGPVNQIIQVVKSQTIDHVIYIFSQSTLNQFQNAEDEINRLTQDINRLALPVTILLTEPEGNSDHLKILSKLNCIYFYNKFDYYFEILELLTKIFPNIDLSNIILEFKEQYKIIIFSEEKSSFIAQPAQNKKLQRNKIFNKKNISIFTISSVLLLISVLMLQLLNSRHRIIKIDNKTGAFEKQLIRSDLPVPADSTLLQRPQLLTQITEKLKKPDGIQTIALVGIGGAGKTTLARQYARSQNSSVVWEINSETHESIISSFENLAYALANTEDYKKILRELQTIKSASEKEEKIILFVKDRLKAVDAWVLIYDNLEKFAYIQKYLPYDPITWGNGKVIITTRDRNVENNKYIDYMIAIEELNSQEKLKLFTQIINPNNKSCSLTVFEEQAKSFLEKVPPFPLDVSAAAYYLKATQISFASYLDHLTHYHQDFAATQENILKEASDYAKTRYNILTLSLNKLSLTHKDFGELLLFISLLDSQNIPKSLLDKYKKSTVVDNFIYNLRKYSLITNESFNHFTQAISMHRSTQEICLMYLKQTFSLEKRNQAIQSIAQTLENYIADAVEKEDFLRMKLLISHCEKFLSHENLLTNAIRSAMYGELGCIYYYLSENTKAKQLLEESLTNLHKYDQKNYNRIAQILLYLGNVYRALGNCEKARCLLEQSLSIYTELPKNFLGAARARGYLGLVYRALGKYSKATNLLEQSLILYQNHSKNSIGHAWILAHLGNTYMILGDYQKAKHLLEQSLKIYKKHSEDYVGVAWVLGYLGDVYRCLGDYVGAQTLLKQSLVICRKHFSENHVYVASTLAYLGSVYKDQGNYEKAKKCLDHSLSVYEKNYGTDHIETARLLRTLGQLYLVEGNLEQAEYILKKTLELFKKHKYSESYISLENLADIYLTKSQQAQHKSMKREFLHFKREAICTLQQAQQIVEDHFSSSSPHIMRIRSKLKDLDNSL